MNIQQLKFPIGTFNAPEIITSEHISSWIADIEAFPKQIKGLTQNLSTNELNWVYRPEGWSIKQVVHHCADSHLNSFTRFKLALTEDNPTIRPYYEDRWAQLIDGTSDDISASLLLLEGLHQKWVFLLKNLSKSELQRTYTHPEHGQQFTLAETIGTYAWHCNHHLAHVQQALIHKGEF